MIDQDFTEAVRKRFGTDMLKTMDHWLKYVGRGNTPIGDLDKWERTLGGVRRNVTIMGLGLRALTVAMQTGGLFSGGEMIGPSAVMKGVVTVFGPAMQGDWKAVKANVDTIRAKSGEMANRARTFERDIDSVALHLDAMIKGNTLRRVQLKIQDIALRPIQIMDGLVATSVWQGAYQKQLDKGIDEKTAINYADKVVRLTQGAAAPKDLASVQRGSEFYKWMTMFYSYFSAYHGRAVDIVRTAESRVGMGSQLQKGPQGETSSNEIVRWMLLVVAPSLVLDTMMRGMFKHEEEPDPKKYWGKAATRMFAYHFAGVPVIRDAIGYLAREEDHFRYGFSPVVTSMQRILENADKHARRNPKPEDSIKFAGDLVGYSLGLPMDAIGIPIWNAIVAKRTATPFGTSGVPVVSDMIVRRQRPKGERL
jgi:hypothetical protein